MNVITIKIGGYINTIMLKKMPYRAIMELINNYIISKLINLLNLYNMGVPSLLKSHFINYTLTEKIKVDTVNKSQGRLTQRESATFTR